MTYQEALQARARLAYTNSAFTKKAAQVKKAEDGNPIPDAVREMHDISNAAGYENVINENQALKQQVGEYNNLKHGLGAGGVGLAGGAGIGAATYGLTGLFPSLKKRRLLRALIALGAGSAGGAGLGYLTYGGLQSGKVQNWANKAMGAAGDAANWVGQKAQAATEPKKDDKSGDGK